MDKVPAAKQALMKVASHWKFAVVLKSERKKKSLKVKWTEIQIVKKFKRRNDEELKRRKVKDGKVERRKG